VRPGWRSWGALALVGVAVACFVGFARWTSPQLPGTAGALYRRNVAEGVEATALVYSESGSVCDYIDPENGRYR